MMRQPFWLSVLIVLLDQPAAALPRLFFSPAERQLLEQHCQRARQGLDGAPPLRLDGMLWRKGRTLFWLDGQSRPQALPKEWRLLRIEAGSAWLRSQDGQTLVRLQAGQIWPAPIADRTIASPCASTPDQPPPPSGTPLP